MKIVFIVIVGAVIGSVMGYLGSCTTGACPLTANPFRGAGFGALLGFLIAVSNMSGRGARESLKESDQVSRVSDLGALQALISGAAVPVMVDFYASWCGPCKRLAPEISALADRWKGQAIVVKVNVDDQPEIAAHYGVSSIPDVRIFSEGQERLSVMGYQSRQALHESLVAAGGDPTGSF